MTTVNTAVDVNKLAAALQANRPIESLLPQKVAGLVDQIAKDRLSSDEYSQFKAIATTSGGIKANRFAKTASAFVEKPGAAAKRTAFVILALERAGRHELAAKLLHKVFSEVAPAEIKRQGFSVNGNE